MEALQYGGAGKGLKIRRLVSKVLVNLGTFTLNAV